MNDFALTLKCNHFGKKRKKEELTNESSMIVGRNHLFANGVKKIYVKYGFCSDFYLRGSSSHCCFLKSTDSIFGNKSRQSTTIKLKVDWKLFMNVNFNLMMKEG